MLAVAGLAAMAAAVQVGRSPAARDLLADWVGPLTESARAPTVAEQRAAELERRLQERVPRPKRELYPERPRVAMLDFAIDTDTWVGDQTARQLSDAARAVLGADGRFEWVDRSQLDTAANELSLSVAVGDASASLELGAWLKCDLVVTGRFVDTGGPTQRLRLEVVDLLTADRVTTRDLPWPGDLRRPETLADAELDRLVTETADVVDAAHRRLTALRDVPVVSLLFFRNVTGHDRLNHLEAVLPERLEENARATPGVRLVQISRPTEAGDEQTLALVGLTRADPTAWARVSDHYLWGHFAETPDTPAPGSAPGAVDPDDVPITVTLYLWSGGDAPQAFTQTGSRAEIEAVVDALAAEAWREAQKPVSDSVSPAQRDAVVELLLGRSVPGLAARGISSSRRGQVDPLARQAAWFLRPEDQQLAEGSIFVLPSPGPGRKWVGLGANAARVDQVIARFGPSLGGGRSGFGTARQKLFLLQGRVDLARGATFQGSTTLGRGRAELPADMPSDARATYRSETLRQWVDLGRQTVAEARDTDPEALPRGRRPRPLDPDRVLPDDLRLTPEQTVAVWDSWWPVLAPAWEAERDKPNRSRFNKRLLDRLTAAYQAAGRSEDYDAMFAVSPVMAITDYRAPALQASEAEALHAWVDRQVAEGQLKRGEAAAPTPVAAGPETPTPTRIDAADTETPGRPATLGVIDHPDTPERVRTQLRQSRTLRNARFDADRAPRHPVSPAVAELAGLAGPGTLTVNWGLSPARELRLAPRTKATAFHAVVPWRGRYAALRTEPARLARNKPDRPAFVRHEGLGLFDPLTLRTDRLDWTIRASRWTDLAVSGDRLWLATPNDGLKTMTPWGDGPWRIGPEDGLLSANIQRVAFDGEALWLMSGDGRLGRVETPEAPDVNDVSLRDVPAPDPWDSQRLEAADGRVAVRRDGHGRAWHWVDSAGVVPVRDGAVGAALSPDDMIADVQADGDGFWVVTALRLLRVAGDGSVVRDVPLPAPPLETLRVRGDGDQVWLAYHWDVAAPASTGGSSRRPPLTDGRSRLILADPRTGAVRGQTQWPGRVHDVFVTPDELHLVMPNLERDVVMVRRAALQQAMGIATPVAAIPADPTEVAPPRDVSPAGWAAYRGQATDVEHLIDEGWPPVVAAVRAGRADTLAELLAAGHPPNAAVYGIHGHSAAALAILTHRLDLLKQLHAAGARLDETHPSFGTLVHVAVLADSAEAIGWLGAHGADLDAYTRIAPPSGFQIAGHAYPYRAAPLHLAVERGNRVAAETLLQAGASVREDTLSDDRMALLLMAARNGDSEMARLLLRHGADPQRGQDRWGSVLDAAVARADPGLVKQLIERGVTHPGAEALAAAVKRGDPEVVALLLAADADPGARGNDQPALRRSGDIPLVRALEARRLDLYALLMKRGDVDLNRTYGDRWRLGDLLATAMMERHFFDAAIDLVARGFSVDVPDKDGDTLLIDRATWLKISPRNVYAVRAELLLALGADPAVRNAKGQNTLSLVESEDVRGWLQNPEPLVTRMRGGVP